jgi:hypothetical protein
MQEPHSKGVVTHTGPESCGYAGNSIGEALTGVQAGRVLSRVSSCVTVRSADAVENVGRRNCGYRHHEITTDSARSKAPSTLGSSMRRNWEIPPSTTATVRTVNPME